MTSLDCELSRLQILLNQYSSQAGLSSHQQWQSTKGSKSNTFHSWINSSYHVVAKPKKVAYNQQQCDVENKKKTVLSTYLTNVYVHQHIWCSRVFNTVESRGNYSATSNDMWSLYTGHWWMGCYIWYSEKGTGWGCSLPSPSSLYQM